jgi:uncharacterized protein YaiL (DUF2058 family)
MNWSWTPLGTKDQRRKSSRGSHTCKSLKKSRGSYCSCTSKRSLTIRSSEITLNSCHNSKQKNANSKKKQRISVSTTRPCVSRSDLSPSKPTPKRRRCAHSMRNQLKNSRTNIASNPASRRKTSQLSRTNTRRSRRSIAKRWRTWRPS